MTDPIDVAAAAIHAATPGLSAHRPWAQLTNQEQGRYRRAATAALEAAMPHIRKQIADEIRERRDQEIATTSPMWEMNPRIGRAYNDAARVAEGENK